jgi:hypothetical protein
MDITREAQKISTLINNDSGLILFPNNHECYDIIGSAKMSWAASWEIEGVSGKQVKHFYQSQGVHNDEEKVGTRLEAAC